MIKVGGITLFTYKEVSKQLGIHIQTISKMVVRGDIKAVRIGKHKYISYPSLRDFVSCIK